MNQTNRTEIELLTIAVDSATTRDDRTEAEYELIELYGYESDYLDQQIYGIIP